MSKDIIGALVGFIIIAVAAVGLLWLGASGYLPVIGILDMENLAVRAVVVVILLVIAGLLYVAFRRTSQSAESEGERKSVP
jgi:hypothetical protein